MTRWGTLVAMTHVSADPGISGRLVSGEAVELDVRVARLGSRVLALAIDLMILTFLGMMLALVTSLVAAIAAMSGFYDIALVQAFYVIDLVILFVAIPAAIETLSKGRSLGKAAVGLRVVRDDGGPIRFRHALVRAVCGFAVEFPGILIPGLTWIAALTVMLINPSGKRFGDLSAGTIVIHERTPDARMWIPAMPAGMAGWASLTDLTALDDDLALAIRHFLARNHEIAEPARTRLGIALATELYGFVVPRPPPGTPGWAFLAAVLAERYRRASGRLAANRAITAQVWDTLYGPTVGPNPWGQPASSSQAWSLPTSHAGQAAGRVLPPPASPRRP